MGVFSSRFFALSQRQGRTRIREQLPEQLSPKTLENDAIQERRPLATHTCIPHPLSVLARASLRTVSLLLGQAGGRPVRHAHSRQLSGGWGGAWNVYRKERVKL